jgi:segregation and condensation protein A
VTPEPRDDAEVVPDDAPTPERAPSEGSEVATDTAPVLPPEAAAPVGDTDGDAATAPHADSGVFQINVPLPDGAFEGPLDLLLHLIERSELDVTEISLLHVTEQYLVYLRSADEINLGALADFVAIGARLLLLKSRALLPTDDDGTHLAEDEGTDLINALREYRRYKQAAEFLRDRDTTHQTYRREAPPPHVPLPTGLDKVTLDSLVEVLREIMDRLPEEEPTATVPRERIRLRDRLRGIVDLLEREQRTSFRRLVENATSRVAVIVDFLAVLELIKSRYVEATQSERFGDIDLVRIEGAMIPDFGELTEDFAGV